MDSLIKSLPTVIRAAGDDAHVVEAAAMAAWRNAAGAGLRSHAQPIALSGQTMVVAVPDAAWQKQLGFLKAELLFRINNLLGRRLVTDIELRIDSRLRQKPTEPSHPSDELESDIPLELLSAARAIEDEQLSQKFLRAAATALKLQERRKKQT